MRALFAASAAAMLAAPAIAQEMDGGALFVEKCGMCHREADRVAGMGTFLIQRRDPDNPAMLEQRKSLTPDFVATVVRAGLGNMPRISRAEVSDDQLAAIADYLAASAAAYVPPPPAPVTAADPIQ